MKKKIITLLLLIIIIITIISSQGLVSLAYSTGYPNTHTNTGNQKEDIIAIAETQIGYTYSGGTKYGAWYSSNLTTSAWCAMFVSWCANQANIPTSIIPKHSSCDNGMNWFKNNGRWHNGAYYGGTYTPQRGDIVYYSDGHTQSDSTHVGIVTGVSGNYLQVIEGNTDSKVYKYTKNAKRTLNNAYVLGYGTPNYNNAPVVTHTIDTSYSKNFTATAKAKMDVFNSDHSDPGNHYVDAGDVCTIHEVYTDGCCKITYPTSSGNKTYYCKISNFATPHWLDVNCEVDGTYYGSCSGFGTADVYVNGTCVGSDISDYYTQHNHGSSYEIKDIKAAAGYKYVGSSVYSGTINNDVSIVLKFESLPSKQINSSTRSVSLTLGGTSTQTIYAWTTGYYNGSYKLRWERSNNNISCSWGEWNSENKLPLTISANSPGDSTITLSIIDSSTEAILHSITINVRITAKTYTVSYNANGGTGAPANQTKIHGSTLILSSTKPTKSYTITYNANGGSVSPASKSVSCAFNYWKATNGTAYRFGENYNENSATTMTAQWTNPTAGTLATPTRTGYTFNGWYTAASGGTKVTSTSVISANTTLYAQWIINDHTISYNANGGTGAPSNQIVNHGFAATISSTIPTRFGYNFLGWSTSSSAASATYSPGTSITVSNDIALYAVWKQVTLGANSSVTTPITFGDQMYYYKFVPSVSGKYVIYSTGTVDTKVYLYNASASQIAYNDDANGSSNRNFSLTADLSAGSTYYYGVKYYYATSTGNISVKFGQVYTIAYNANGGTGAPSNQDKIYGTALTLSSTKPTKSYTITYNANGGSVSAASKSVPCTFNNWKAANGTTYQPGGVYALDSATTLTAQWTNPTAGTLPTLTRTGYTFNGWYTAASGGTKITPTSVISANTTLYAQWIINTHTITFNANGGTGAPSNIIVNHGSTATLSSTAPTRFGYTFLGWSTSSSATAATYKSGDTITVTSDMALYAVWKSAEVISSNVTNSSYTAAIASSGDFKYFKFTPAATSKYRFESTGSSDPQIYLYDANGSLLASNDDGGESRNFLLDYKFNAGTTYYIKVNMYSTGTGTVNFSVKRINDIAITTQPKTTYAKLNETASVTIAATGDGLTYAWYFKNPSSSSYTKSAITSATYSATMQKALSGRQVYCVVSDKYGNTVKSNTVYLYLTATITKQPVNTTVAIGSAAKASITAAGDGLTYTWYFKNPGSSSYTKSGVTSSTYTMTMQSSLSGRQVYCVVTDKYGNTAKSNTVTLKAASLKITTQPKTSYTKLNVTANATVAASGEGLKYTWYFKNPGSSTYTKSGITSSTYSVAMQKSISGRQVYCVVSDKYGNTAKSNTVTLYLAVTITKQPVSTIAAAETRLSIPLTAVGDGLTYQWYYIKPGTNTSVTSGVDYSSYNIKMEADYDGRRVYCIVTDKYGNTAKSNTVTINVPPAAKITTQPKTTYAKVNETAKVTIAASGDGLKYTWYFKNPGSSTYTKSGITSSTYSVTMQNAVAGRKVYCVVSDKYGNSVKSNTITLCLTASITTQPKSAYAKAGDTAKISVAAAGDGLTYTWYFKNPGSSSYTKSGITASTYSVTMQSAISGRKVYCVVADKYGNSIKSDTVTLYINATITKQPTSTSATAGSKATVSVTAAGNGLTYTWYFKNPGSSSYTKSSITSSTYTMTMQESLSGRKVYCVVTDKKGNSVRSNTVTLTTLTVTVKPVPGIDAVLK